MKFTAGAEGDVPHLTYRGHVRRDIKRTLQLFHFSRTNDTYKIFHVFVQSVVRGFLSFRRDFIRTLAFFDNFPSVAVYFKRSVVAGEGDAMYLIEQAVSNS